MLKGFGAARSEARGNDALFREETFAQARAVV